MIKLLVLMLSLLAVTAGHAQNNDVVRVQIPLFDQEYNSAGGQAQIIPVKRFVKRERPDLRLKNFKLRRVVLLAKSKRGQGKATLLVGGVKSQRKVLPGHPSQYYDNHRSTYTRVPLKNTTGVPQGTWRVKLNGNIKIKKIVVVLVSKFNQPHPEPPLPPRPEPPLPEPPPSYSDTISSQIVLSACQSASTWDAEADCFMAAVQNDSQLGYLMDMCRVGSNQSQAKCMRTGVAEAGTIYVEGISMAQHLIGMCAYGNSESQAKCFRKAIVAINGPMSYQLPPLCQKMTTWSAEAQCYQVGLNNLYSGMAKAFYRLCSVGSSNEGKAKCMRDAIPMLNNYLTTALHSGCKVMSTWNAEVACSGTLLQSSNDLSSGYASERTVMVNMCVNGNSQSQAKCFRESISSLNNPSLNSISRICSQTTTWSDESYCFQNALNR